VNPTTTHHTIATLKIPRGALLLLALAKMILQALTANSAFLNPDPSLAVLQAAIVELEAAIALVQTRAKGAVATRNQKVAVVAGLLRQLRAYVEKVADASPEHAAALIQSAAMNVKKVTVRARRAFAVKHGTVSGSVLLVTAYAGPRASYEWAFSADAGKTWQEARATLQSKTTISGLQPGATVLFRYRPVTKKADTDWSQPLSLIVQ
jgi:hypothetical protein